ncbi:MAG: dTDP-glucose 4,6-dehydratase [Rhodocyclales bacterium]|nr:dTDP-glucose 4,6-dehydratase [Rhodocyclales bacterium]
MFPRLPDSDLKHVLEQTPEFWSQHQGVRIFVTGGSGFIGSWLLELVLYANRMHDAGMQVVALSRDPERARIVMPHLFEDASLSWVRGDAQDFAWPDGAFDMCIHAAADVADPARAADHRRVFDTAVLGTRRVLDFAEHAGVHRFLFTSSGAVYGPQPPSLARMPEDFLNAPDVLDARTAYGQGKRAAEWQVAERARSSAGKFSIARIFALLGPRLPLDGTLAAGNFIRDALAGQPILVRGDGTAVRSYLYMADACVWLLRMMSHESPLLACNLGSEEEVSIARLAAQVEELSGSKGGVRIMEQAVPDVLPQRYVPDTQRTRKVLRIGNMTSLHEALDRTIKWQRAANS